MPNPAVNRTLRHKTAQRPVTLNVRFTITHPQIAEHPHGKEKS